MKKILSVVFVLFSLTVFGQSKLKPHYKGYDFFALDKKLFIVRSDIGLFLNTKSLTGTGQSNIYNLNEAMANAKAYIGFKSGDDWKRCVIREDSYTTYDALTKIKGKRYTIGSELAKNGDHYFAKSPEGKSKSVYVIKGNNYYVFSKLSDSKPKTTGVLPKYLQEGDVVAYWARRKYIYILRNTENGPMIFRTTSLRNQNPSTTVSAPSEPVRNFLIGGLAINDEGAKVEWVPVDSSFPFCNNGNSPVAAPKISNSITTGYVKGYESTIEHNWSMSATVSKSAEVTVGLKVIQSQVELTASYGGASIKTNSSQWSTENTSTVSLDEGKQVEPGKCIGYWQGRITINGEIVMTTGIVYTDNGEKPTITPNFNINK